MSKKFKVPTLDEAQEELKNLIKLSKRFEGFKICLNLKDELQVASINLEEGKERESIEAIQAVSRGIKATLIGFFRGSPGHFQRSRERLELHLTLDKDIRNRMDKALREEEVYAKLQLGIDLEKAADFYNLAFSALCSAEQEQKIRNENRRKRREEEEKEMNALHAEEQKAEEKKRRLQKAESLREIADLMNI